MKRLLDFDPITKTRRVFHYDQVEEKATIETKQDVTACVELTQAEFNAMDERAPWKGDFVKAASIPLSVMGKLMREGIWYDDAALRKWLNDRDNRKLRTHTGRV
jgi:hypothetical protein